MLNIYEKFPHLPNVYYITNLSKFVHSLSQGTVVESKNQIRQCQNNAIANALHKEVQTEAFVVYPYEHLFPLILPQTTLDQKSVTKVFWRF